MWQDSFYHYKNYLLRLLRLPAQHHDGAYSAHIARLRLGLMNRDQYEKNFWAATNKFL